MHVNKGSRGGKEWLRWMHAILYRKWTENHGAMEDEVRGGSREPDQVQAESREMKSDWKAETDLIYYFSRINHCCVESRLQG